MFHTVLFLTPYCAFETLPATADGGAQHNLPGFLPRGR